MLASSLTETVDDVAERTTELLQDDDSRMAVVLSGLTLIALCVLLLLVFCCWLCVQVVLRRRHEGLTKARRKRDEDATTGTAAQSLPQTGGQGSPPNSNQRGGSPSRYSQRPPPPEPPNAAILLCTRGAKVARGLFMKCARALWSCLTARASKLCEKPTSAAAGEATQATAAAAGEDTRSASCPASWQQKASRGVPQVLPRRPAAIAAAPAAAPVKGVVVRGVAVKDDNNFIIARDRTARESVSHAQIRRQNYRWHEIQSEEPSAAVQKPSPRGGWKARQAERESVEAGKKEQQAARANAARKRLADAEAARASSGWAPTPPKPSVLRGGSASARGNGPAVMC